MTPKISIITPVLDHPEFCEAYARAVDGAECIIVDTGSNPENGLKWGCIPSVRHSIAYGISGHNYGHWCNTGFAHATGDIVVFLNNDVRADGDWLSQVAEDVKPGAIYGPELLAQVVGGIKVPFLSGWCIAATHNTWFDLIPKGEIPNGAYGARSFLGGGPWNTVDYPAAGYWEDNDLSLRAVMGGIELRQTRWPIVHLDNGNGTSKHRKEYYADVERNKATFAQAVRDAMQREVDKAKAVDVLEAIREHREARTHAS